MGIYDIDPSVLTNLGLFLPRALTCVTDDPTVYPGASFHFAWKMQSRYTAGWDRASVEVREAAGGNLLWARRNFPWPPPESPSVRVLPSGTPHGSFRLISLLTTVGGLQKQGESMKRRDLLISTGAVTSGLLTGPHKAAPLPDLSPTFYSFGEGYETQKLSQNHNRCDRRNFFWPLQSVSGKNPGTYASAGRQAKHSFHSGR